MLWNPVGQIGVCFHEIPVFLFRHKTDRRMDPVLADNETFVEDAVD